MRWLKKTISCKEGPGFKQLAGRKGKCGLMTFTRPSFSRRHCLPRWGLRCLNHDTRKYSGDTCSTVRFPIPCSEEHRGKINTHPRAL